ncbi:hypothetical protein Corgl_1359 [Coriobacterium glomerans PW2]|uniref:NADPH-dependent FMN reductase-like domain-containing protein n=1 Tax=Coriobacterium glomerans (strain ATCC 49209 / DSM 20642 / JCM 10262 / PW2) TaxID=700015 RepID=F2N8S7_CORGP|nr:hypothetical protein [Coriobacterium glomerans]AEB07460.1 hypothetical protein Corgl_1359 [Coriobacterium glomerans PW2]
MRVLICDIERDDRRRSQLDEACDVVIGPEVLGDSGDCRGCLSCWTATPGPCVIRDAPGDLGALLGAADELWIASRNTFGAVSSPVKCALDRWIPAAHPCSRIIDRKTHHRRRYGGSARAGGTGTRTRTSIWLYGASSACERSCFMQIASTMCDDVGLDLVGVWFPERADELGVASAAFEGARPGQPVRASDARPSARPLPGRIACVCASPNGDASATSLLLDDFEDAFYAYERISAHSFEDDARAVRDEHAEIIRFQMSADGELRQREVVGSSCDATSSLETLASCDTIVIGYPVYLAALPSGAIRLLEQLSEMDALARGARIYAISNLGLYDAARGRAACGVLGCFCRVADLMWGGALVVAGDGMIVPTAGTPRMGRLRRRTSEAIDQLILAVRTGASIMATDGIIEVPCALPRFLYRWKMRRRCRALARETGRGPDEDPR